MTEASTERAIGRLEGKLDGVADSVEEYKRESSAGRKRIYEELEAIRSEAAENRVKVADIAEKFKAAEPTLTDIKKWKERLIGMWMAFTAIGFVTGAAITYFWKWVAAKLGI